MHRTALYECDITLCRVGLFIIFKIILSISQIMTHILAPLPLPPSLPPEAAFDDSAAFAATYQTVTEVVIILRSLSAAWNDVYVRVPGRSRHTLVGPAAEFRRRRFGGFFSTVCSPPRRNLTNCGRPFGSDSLPAPSISFVLAD